MIKQTIRDLSDNREYLLRSIFMALGGVFLLIESYEVVTGEDIKLWFSAFLLLGLVTGFGWFYVDGHFLAGFLRRHVRIKNKNIDTPVTVKFGDLFVEKGWKAIGANDFFDSIVDNDLVSCTSLHGQVIDKFWPDNRDDWERQVEKAVKGVGAEKVERSKGNKKRFAIGTTVPLVCKEHKFLFVALARTNLADNVTKAKTNDLIVAIRGLLQCARIKCANEPLIIPLMGSGLGRVGIENAILVDLILAAIVEETKQMKITDNITIILPEEKSDEINLGAIARDWN